MTEYDYPYVAHRQETCYLRGETTRIKAAVFLHQDEASIIDWLIHNGPVNVGQSFRLLNISSLFNLFMQVINGSSLSFIIAYRFIESFSILSYSAASFRFKTYSMDFK